MKYLKSVLFICLIPVIAIAQTAVEIVAPVKDNIPDMVLGLHPMVWPAIAIVYYILQVADSYIPEKNKAEWPAVIRQGWDWVLRNVGESRNASSSDSN